jgi:hypothetical protein
LWFGGIAITPLNNARLPGAKATYVSGLNRKELKRYNKNESAGQ